MKITKEKLSVYTYSTEGVNWSRVVARRRETRKNCVFVVYFSVSVRWTLPFPLKNIVHLGSFVESTQSLAEGAGCC